MTLNGQEIHPSICSWRYEREIDGENVTIQSGDYLNQSAVTYPLDSFAFEVACVEQPTNFRVVAYQGNEELATLEQEEISSYFSLLPSGQYQLIALLEWNKESLILRAGYSFTLSIP